MEPVDVNIGAYYLRALRADDAIDDRPVVLAMFTDPETTRWVPHYRVTTIEQAGEYVARRAREWATGERCSWAVAEPTTGRMLAEVGLKTLDAGGTLDDGEAEVACVTAPDARGRGVAAYAVAAVVRFGFGALGLRTIAYRFLSGNAASARVAVKAGFTDPPAPDPSDPALRITTLTR